MITRLNSVCAHIEKYYFNNKKEIDKKMIEYFKDNLLCVRPNTIYLIFWL